MSPKCYYKKDQRWTVHDSVDPKHKSESATSSPNRIKKNNNNKNQNKTSSSSSVHEYLNIFPCASTGHLKTQTCILPGGCKSNLLLKVHNGLFMNASFPQNSMLLKVCNMKGMPSC